MLISRALNAILYANYTALSIGSFVGIAYRFCATSLLVHISRGSHSLDARTVKQIWTGKGNKWALGQ